MYYLCIIMCVCFVSCQCYSHKWFSAALNWSVYKKYLRQELVITTCIFIILEGWTVWWFVYFMLSFSLLSHPQNVHLHCPLFEASSKGYTKIVDTLLKNGADPNLGCIVCGLMHNFHTIMYFWESRQYRDYMDCASCIVYVSWGWSE